jgi:glutathione S-transferase
MSIKLYYFDACGRAEATRWILKHAGVEFEDVRFPFGKPPSIPQDIKSRCRWGQVPLAELENGKTLTQSLAVCRYFARRYNLVPSDPYQAALCDEYVDAVSDIVGVLRPVVYLPEGDDKKQKMAEAIKTTKSRFIDVFESIVKKNGGKHLVGDKLTWADIVLAQCIEQFQMWLGVNLAEGSENITKLKDNVTSQPKIKAWIAIRPKTPF